jgi:tRNA(Ile)-lysidine synthase
VPAAKPIADAEAARLFAGFADAPSLVLAVSGGPDSTALLVMAARWRARRKNGPKLLAVTVDHGLRRDARREAAAVKRLARTLGVPHRTVTWTGKKPATGIQEQARAARYALLVKEAQLIGARYIVTAHTRDDQAETMLFRMARGSGIAGLAAMAPLAPVPAWGEHRVVLCRPLLDLPKARLTATLQARRIAFAHDASNDDPRFARVRWRTILPTLAQEGLDAARLSALAGRLRRANAAIEIVVDAAARQLLATAEGPVTMARERFFELPEEIALRLVGRAIAQIGDEGPVELAKLERMMEALVAAAASARMHFRRTLAGAMITLSRDRIAIERAPARRNAGKSP